MLLIDQALTRRAAIARPIQVGIIGAGTLGTGIVHQIMRHVPGITVAALYNRHIERAQRAFQQVGADHAAQARSVAEMETNIKHGRPSYTDDPTLVCQAHGIDVIVEVTGTIEFASGVCLAAFSHGKPVILVNAELEATLGPILKHRADQAGVIFSGSDGDQPGVTMNLFRFVGGLGLRPLLCGNIKGMQDPYRTPETQAEFARKWDQAPNMVTSFADGTKISFEQAAVANATGMTVAERGMTGLHFDGHVDELVHAFDASQLEAMGGAVDYVVGASPGPGVFVFANSSDPYVQKNLKLYKLGDGPLYSFYTPYHLCFLEVPSSIARVVEFQDPVMAPLGGPFVEVVAVAKRNLITGERLDGIGGYTLYGEAEKSSIARDENLLPIGLAEGCRLIRPIMRDSVLTFDDVELPPNRLCDRLWQEQCTLFSTSHRPTEQPLSEVP
jgi:predicted homoserine dehydrogenase-like protein